MGDARKKKLGRGRHMGPICHKPLILLLLSPNQTPTTGGVGWDGSIPKIRDGTVPSPVSPNQTLLQRTRTRQSSTLQFQLQCKKYFQEAEWSSKNYTPSFQEHVDVSVVSTSLPLLFLVALMGAGQLATKEAFEWALDIPDMVLGCAETGRFLNDIASYKQGRKCNMDVASSLECYITEHGVTVSDAMATFATKVEHAWRRINQEYMQLDRGILPAAQLAVNMTRLNVLWYLRGRDAYSSSGSLKETVASLFVKDFPI